MTTPAKIGALLQEARAAKRLPKTQVAATAGISRNTLQQLEVGLGNVELKTLLAVCDVLGLDIVLEPREVAAKVQRPLSANPTRVTPPSNQPNRSGDILAIRKPSNFLSRLIHDKEMIATGNFNRALKSGFDVPKKEKK